MRQLSVLMIFSFTYYLSIGQKPADGTYTYKIAFEEWHGKSLGATCRVVIKGDSVKVFHDGNKSLTGKEGDVIDIGVLMKHRSRKWIIGKTPKDKEAKELGGCGDGPRVIDFKRKLIWSC